MNLYSIRMVDIPGDLLYALWNVYCYYHQFQDIMDKAMATNRTPIEKELKVKLAHLIEIFFPRRFSI